MNVGGVVAVDKFCCNCVAEHAAYRQYDHYPYVCTLCRASGSHGVQLEQSIEDKTMGMHLRAPEAQH